jgi:hypothetical protein
LSSHIDVTSVEDRRRSNVASGIVRAVARREDRVYRLAEVHVVLDTMTAVAFSERRRGCRWQTCGVSRSYDGPTPHVHGGRGSTG